MHIIVGDTRGGEGTMCAKIQELNWGRMACEVHPKPFAFERWGFDNKAFPAWSAVNFPIGLSIDDWCILWDADEFEDRVKHIQDNVTSEPYMAVCPDIPGAGLASLEWSLMWRNQVPDNWPWYLAVQDGMEPKDILDCLHLFEGIFLGGSDKFKGTAAMWSKFAHTYQKKFHYGRAGTLEKVKHAFMCDADSCDSAFPLWTWDRFNAFVRAVGSLEMQPLLTESAPS